MGEKGKHKAWLLAAGTLLAGTALLAGGFIRTEGSKVKTYPQQAGQGYSTLLLYLDGSDLESAYGAARDDLEEIRRAVGQADPEGTAIRIVVEAGGARQWQYSQMEDCSYGRFSMTGAGVSEVVELETRDMGRADTLADFINYGIQSYPAEHYGLIFWNHGAGQIEGFGRDENFGYSALSLMEIKEGLELSAYQEPFDFIGMDACLMGSLEMVSVLQGKTEYFIASEELEPQDGYDYHWVESLTVQEEGVPYGKQAGLAMLKSFEEFYQGKKFLTTLALVDMGNYGKFHNAFDKLLSLLPIQQAGSETMYQELGRLRGQIQGFGQPGAESMPEQVDAMDLARHFIEAGSQGANQGNGLAGKVSVEELQDMYRGLEEAYRQMVVKKVWSGYTQEPSGMSLYLPSGDNSQIRLDERTYQTILFCGKYKAFVEDYTKYLAAGQPIPWQEPVQGGGELKIPIPPSQQAEIANAYGTVSVSQDGCTYLLSADGDVALGQPGYLKARMEDTFWGLKGEILCLIENYTENGETEYAAPILYQKEGSGWEKCKMRIRFSESCPDGEIVQIEPYETSKQVYTLDMGDALIPLYPLLGQEEGDGAGLGLKENHPLIGLGEESQVPLLGQKNTLSPVQGQGEGALGAEGPVSLLEQKNTLSPVLEQGGDGLGEPYPIFLQPETITGEDASPKEERIYQNEYYMGSKLTIENMQAGDADLEKIRWEENTKLQYGFLIRDTRMELHYVGA